MNKMKERPYMFLMVDDDKEYFDSLYRRGKDHRIILTHANSLDLAKKIFESEKGKTFCGVILDAVCLKERTQQVADANFLAPAVDYFRNKAPHLQLVILTGVPEEYRHLKEHYREFLKVYSKGRDEKDMLSFLKEKAQDIPREKVIRQHNDAFEVVERWLGLDAEDRLVRCLQQMTQSDPAAITGTLGNLRKLQEQFYIGLNKVDNKMVPDQLIKSDRMKIENDKILNHLNGYDPIVKKQKGIIYVRHYSKEDRLLNLIYRCCSEEIHFTDQNTSRYTAQTLVYAFMDMVLWLGKIAELKRDDDKK